ncbi:MAG: hypothetical protein A2516_07070 [Alphaproteobacteria bacterium RIFOXYD12_FULL_60_8]|nr:MAG: hypothetical protein A2516_07070 [Alphaproteobacteria bacterium RIFOXYD12_FULL_60_8]
MSLSLRALFCLTLAASVITGCGFQPLYGGRAAPNIAVSEFNKIKIDMIEDRAGQQLRNLLLLRLNPQGEPVNPAYYLEVTVSEAESQLGVRKDATASRANLTLTASYKLKGKDGDAYANEVKSVVSYNILTAVYATLAAKKDAQERGLVEISNMIRSQLGSYFTGRDKS